MQPKEREMKTRRSPLNSRWKHPLITGMLLVAAIIPAVALAQQLAQSGNALDANLQLGSGGYNGVSGRAASPFQHSGFNASRGTQSNLMLYNAFLDERSYHPTRTGPTWSSSSGATTGEGPSSQHAASFDDGYAAGRAAAQADSEEARRQMELLSYGVGFYLGQEIRQGLDTDGYDADDETLVTGFSDGLNVRQPRVPADEIARILAELKRRMANKTANELMGVDPNFKRLVDENGTRSRKFLDSFASRGGVTALPNGILYEVLVDGDGPQPQLSDTVVVNYRLMGLDDTVRIEVLEETFDLDTATEGGVSVLTRMKAGSKWRVAIPPSLAYGAAGSPPEVGPNEVVYGEIELLEVKPPE